MKNTKVVPLRIPESLDKIAAFKGRIKSIWIRQLHFDNGSMKELKNT